MFKQTLTIEIERVHPVLEAAIKAADDTLGWDATKTLRWLTSPIYGVRILVHDTKDYCFIPPNFEETRFRFCIFDNVLYGWFHGAIIELSQNKAYARSCCGHWIELIVDEDGGLQIKTDSHQSLQSWGDCTNELSIPPHDLALKRAARIRAAIKR